MIAQSQYRREFIIRKWSLGSHPHLGYHLGKMALTVPQQEKSSPWNNNANSVDFEIAPPKRVFFQLFVKKVFLTVFHLIMTECCRVVSATSFRQKVGKRGQIFSRLLTFKFQTFWNERFSLLKHTERIVSLRTN